MTRRKKAETVTTDLEAAANPLPHLTEGEQQPERTAQRVRLLKPHTHAGRDYPAGVVLEVAPHIARWVMAQGVAKAEPEVSGGKVSSRSEAPAQAGQETSSRPHFAVGENAVSEAPDDAE
jgi:hypothetical protein